MLSEQEKKKLEEILQIEINDKKLLKYLEKAITHRSYSVENNNIEDNSRLEFLGDAVLDLITAKYLFGKYKKYSEGKLTSTRSEVISAKALKKIADNLEIDNLMRVSIGARKDEKGMGKIIGDGIEAIIGAIFITKGYKFCEKTVNRWFKEILEKIRFEEVRNYKGLLLEYFQKETNEKPVYSVKAVAGAEHKPEYTVCVLVNNKFYGEGKGSNKKEAEQRAAKQAYEKIIRDGKK